MRVESAELLELLELESFGERYFEELEIERMRAESEAQHGQ